MALTPWREYLAHSGFVQALPRSGSLKCVAAR